MLGPRTTVLIPIGFFALLAAGLAFSPAEGEKSAAPGEPSDFIRFKKGDEPGVGQLQTAVASYGRGPVRLDLVAAVHVADPSYWRELQVAFEDYDALLYEMVKPKDAVVVRGARDGGLLSTFQRAITDVLELEFQLDGIDYNQKNFVHADMDPASFFRRQREKGESVVSLMMKAMLAQWQQQMEGEGSNLTMWHMLAALASKDSARTLKYFVAEEFDEIEKMIAGFDGSEGGEGSVLLVDRNKTAIEVLELELGRGRQHLAIFYGAAHMPDLEARVLKLGFRKTGETWLTAWDIRKRPEPKAGGDAEDPGKKPRRRAE